ncbi:hypothetical protein PITC_021430 [Penicillium italicum]|uniref:Mg2+ transporter protein, CorA-like/Zinc transport protein ZntB n=1 Tax=Penicillium italicum TaxID=40296 RepID=A0A0A2KDP0_PENIT|nr:hypothetical protein PITC_021430 [Penicillium italicum]
MEDTIEASLEATRKDTPIDTDVSLPQNGLIDELHTAIECNNLDAVQRLLNNHAVLEAGFIHQFEHEDTVQKDVTPLMLAAELGHSEIVQLLLNRGANVFATTDIKSTALYFAALRGHESIVETLSSHGGKKLLEMATVVGRTPLLAAAFKGHPFVIKFLLDKGADINAMGAGKEPNFKGRRDFAGYWVRPENREMSAFSLAAQGGHLAALDVLLSQMTKTKFENDHGSEALHFAAQGGHLVVVKRLLKDHIGLLDSHSKNDKSAISTALGYGHMDVFEYLLNKGANLTPKGYGNTTLHYAVKHGHFRAVDLILTKEPSLLDLRKGQTAICTALQYGHLDIFDYLFDKGADMTICNSDTPLHYASRSGHLRVVQKILTKEPSLLDLKGSNRQAAISDALRHGHFDIFDYLFNKGADVSIKGLHDHTTLHYAAMAGHLQAVKKILTKAPGLLESEEQHLYRSALVCALLAEHVDVVKYLVEVGANFTRLWRRRSALHLACSRGSKFEDVVQLMLKKLTFDQNDPRYDRKRAMFDMSDESGDPTLVYAIRHRGNPIFFQFLETGIYFPRFPASDEPFYSIDCEVEFVEPFLSKLVDGKSEEIHEHREAILYWAILNGKDELVGKCISKIPSLKTPTPWQRGGASWAHVAALGGHTRILEQLLLERFCTIAPTQENISPFHLAVKHNHIELVRYLVAWLGGSHTAHQSVIPGTENKKTAVLRDILHEEGGVLSAIIRKQHDGQTSISLAASGTTEAHRQMERFLWETLDNNIDKASFFSKPLKDDAKLVLELAAQFEAPGEETYLARFLKSISRPSFSEVSGSDAFYLAVYHRLPVVVWWLLSNGWYLSGNHIEKGQQIISTWGQHDPVGNIIKEILENPPPLRDHQVWRYDEHLPTFQFSSEDHGFLEGTVLDFYHEKHQCSIQLKRRSMAAIIYDEGPEKIMKPGRYLDLSSLRAVLSSPTEFSKDMHNKRETTAAFAREDKSDSEKQRVPDLRWIHIPSNNELMVRISQDQQIKNKDHRPWAQFVRKSWAELPAGGNMSYMKPQCVHYQQPKTIHDDQASVTETDNQSVQISNLGRSVLYMPYLFWKKCPAELPHNTDKDSVPLAKSASATQTKMTHPMRTSQTTQGRHIFHDSMTLDQYYYSSLEDTTIRDMDQVLWRSTDPKLKQSENKTGRNLDLLGDRQPNDDIRKILIVNQLWLWILDEKTIITSTTNEIDETESSFLQRVLNNLRAQEKNSSISVENIQELILSTATSFFNKKDVEVLGNKKSPLGVYRAAILNVRDKEAHLFDVFQKSLDGTATEEEGQANANESTNKLSAENEGPSESQDVKNETGLIGRLFKSKGTWKGRDKYNPYGDIAGETELLREVKDICDELNMLKSLASDQESVWRQIWKNGYNPDATFTYNSPSEVKKEITEMVKEAEFVQKAIDMLLDLKQKQANIVEAEFSRKRSEETAKQSDTIMAFTVVTILFLPASFLTSLLALDISDFPHVGGNVRFQGRMIFPIIFGVSIFVSGFFAVIAYNASTLKEYAFGRRKSQKRKMTTNTTVEPKEQTLQQAKLQMEQLREQLILSKRMKKEDEYSWSISGGEQMV